MKQAVKSRKADPAALARALSEAIERERIIPRFVDSYVVSHQRQALQVHPALYRDLLGILQREGLLTVVVLALDLHRGGFSGAKRGRALQPPHREFRKKFLASIVRQKGWGAGEALDFHRDLQLYEELLGGSAAAKRKRKPFEVASHPFVDRSAFLLDSSFIEQARQAATRALAHLEELCENLVSAELGLAPRD